MTAYQERSLYMAGQIKAVVGHRTQHENPEKLWTVPNYVIVVKSFFENKSSSQFMSIFYLLIIWTACI